MLQIAASSRRLPADLIPCAGIKHGNRFFPPAAPKSAFSCRPPDRAPLQSQQQLVDRDRQQRDKHGSPYHFGHGVLVETLEQNDAEPARIDPGGDRRDADDRQRGDPHPAQNDGQRERQLDPREQPPAAEARAGRRLANGGLDGAEARDYVADQHQLAVQDERGQRRLLAEPQQRNQQGEHAEARNGIHDSEHRQDRHGDAAVPGQPVACGQRDQQRDRQRRSRQEQMLPKAFQQIVIMSQQILRHRLPPPEAGAEAGQASAGQQLPPAHSPRPPRRLHASASAPAPTSGCRCAGRTEPTPAASIPQRAEASGPPPSAAPAAGTDRLLPSAGARSRLPGGSEAPAAFQPARSRRRS
ncbi:hypothetical protein BN871_HX_00230 [Paenibacillus sp. P22]|nr:hypothetical protein BN871_HX_00230 [Paenibacillus sp. P22]